MTDTIENLSHGLTVHIKALEAEFAKQYVENLAKWLCRQDGKMLQGEDGSTQWWEYMMTARQILQAEAPHVCKDNGSMFMAVCKICGQDME